MEEEACIAQRLEQAAPISALHGNAAAFATKLIEGARKRTSKGLDAFLASYGLNTEEGIALMCLAEALLRIPDQQTADALIRDKLANVDWAEHLGESKSVFVNAATFSLMLTGEVLRGGVRSEAGLANTLRRTTGRLGEPVIRQAVQQAMKILGGQFVYARTIEEAMNRAEPERKKRITHSFDMLGEAAMTFDDAENYARAYWHAIERLGQEPGGVHGGPGISVKLSALYPKYDFLHAAAARKAIVPIVRELGRAGARGDIHFTVDAEEAERLELSMDIIEALLADDTLFAKADGRSGTGSALPSRAIRNAPWSCAAGLRGLRASTTASCSCGWSKAPIGMPRSS